MLQRTQSEGKALNHDALREQLADLEHWQWAHWTRHMLGNLTPENIERWRRQIEAPYSDLTEEEKDSDRKWANEVLNLPGMKAILEKAEKWDKLVPLLTRGDGDEEKAIEVYMARAQTAFLTETLGRCLQRKERLEAVKRVIERFRDNSGQRGPVPTKGLIAAYAAFCDIREILEDPL